MAEGICEVRVAVIRKTDSMFVGSMPAMVGMVTRYGNKEDGFATIAKLNVKSVTYNTGDRESHGICINLDEARKFGWPNVAGCKPYAKLRSIRESR